MQEVNLTVLGCVIGIAFIAVGIGIHYAYNQRRPPGDTAVQLPEFLIRLFVSIGHAGRACLALGVAVVAAAFLLGPGLPMQAGLHVPVSLYYAAALGLLLVILTYNVLHHRVRSLLASGNREDPTAARIARVHANFAEYVPTGLALLLALEWAGAPALLVHVGGAVFTLGRYLHAWGFTHGDGVSFGRIIGIQATLFGLAYLAAAAFLYLFLI